MIWPPQDLFKGTFGTDEVASRTVECTRGEGGVARQVSVAMEEEPWRPAQAALSTTVHNGGGKEIRSICTDGAPQQLVPSLGVGEGASMNEQEADNIPPPTHTHTFQIT